MPNEFWGVSEDSDLPRLFESTCVGDPGCGGTHFDSDRFAYTVEYWQFSSNEVASRALEKERSRGWRIIREGEIHDSVNQITGHKVVGCSNTKVDEKACMLAWTRGSRFAIVKASSITAISAYESDRGL
jgi:hypothetical protein